MCCWSWDFQGLVTMQLARLCTVAVQCTVPSGLHEMVTPDIDGHPLHGAGVNVWVGVRVSVAVRESVGVGIGGGVGGWCASRRISVERPAGGRAGGRAGAGAGGRRGRCLRNGGEWGALDGERVVGVQRPVADVVAVDVHYLRVTGDWVGWR